MKTLKTILVILVWLLVIAAIFTLSTSGIKVTLKDLWEGLWAGVGFAIFGLILYGILVFIIRCIQLPFNVHQIRKNTEK